MLTSSELAFSSAPSVTSRPRAQSAASAHRPTSVSTETMARAIRDEGLIDDINNVAGTMDMHLSHVRPSQYEPFLTHGSSPASPLAQTNEVVEFYSKIQTGFKTPDLAAQLQRYLFVSLQLHDGGDRFKDVDGSDEDKHKRALLVHGLVQRDALQGFSLLNQLMSSYGEEDKEHLRQLMVEMQPIRIALPVRRIDPAKLKTLVDAIKDMGEVRDFDSAKFERFEGELSDALPEDIDQHSLARINYLLTDFETFNPEEQRSRLAEIRLMMHEINVPYKLREPKPYERMTWQKLKGHADFKDRIPKDIPVTTLNDLLQLKDYTELENQNKILRQQKEAILHETENRTRSMLQVKSSDLKRETNI